MGQLLHGSARTTAAVRRAIQHSQESIAKLAKRYDLNPKTAAKWKKRTQVHEAPMGPKQPRSPVLTLEEEALTVVFRKHTLLPLDDCLYALQATLPHLTRSALHRCLQRHGISRLPDMAGEKPTQKRFKSYPIGTSISTSRRSALKKASSTYLSPLIVHANLPMPSSMKKPTKWSLLSSYGT
jgi:transposase-like protein